jgi:signal transduction histidine kinase
LVNREGFVPDRAYELLVQHVRTGIDLSTRLRAAASQERRATRKTTRSKKAGGRESRTIEALDKSFDEGLREAKAARAALGAQDYSRATTRLERAQVASKSLISEGNMLRVLASVGTQMSAFTHEINALLGSSEALERALSKLREDESLPRANRASLTRLYRQTTELRRGLERQAAYLIDVVSLDARRRRRRMPLSERFDAAARLVSRSAERRGIQIINEIPENLKSPPMFPAEITTVFSNLLTNAVKAAGRNGRIRASGHTKDGARFVIIENTGKRVSLRNAERWFEPFESTTTNVDVALGQGMGLGLPITRSLLEEYGTEVRFVQPRRGYSTALELVFS